MRGAGGGVSTIQRLEAEPDRLPATLATLDALRQALEATGVEFVEDGVRARRVIPGSRRK